MSNIALISCYGHGDDQAVRAKTGHSSFVFYYPARSSGLSRASGVRFDATKSEPVDNSYCCST